MRNNASGLGLVSSFGCSTKEEAYERPNILFAISDDQSFPHTGAYNHDHPRKHTGAHSLQVAARVLIHHVADNLIDAC